jgi:ketosteroid isomerase-like protein
VSQRDVDIVRRALAVMRESHERGRAVQELIDMCTPDVRVDASRRVFNPAVYEGSEGVQRTIRDIRDSWEDFEEINERIIDAGDQVVVIQTISARGRASDVPVKQKGALVFTLTDGAVELIEVFLDPDEALRAAGIEGPALTEAGPETPAEG